MQLFHVQREDDVYRLKPSNSSPSSIKGLFTQKNNKLPRSSGFRFSSRRYVPISPLVSNVTPSVGSIDVVRDFDWTSTPKNNTGFPVIPPSIQLVERELTTSTFVSEFQYFLKSAGDLSNSLGRVAGFGDVFADFKAAVGTLNIVDSLQDAAGSVGLKDQFNTLQTSVEGIATRFNNLNTFDLEGFMEPYDGLYLSRPSGFVYNFPYFTNTFRSVTNDFGSSYKGVGGGIASTLLDAGYTGLDLFSTPVGITQPGAYVERPKYYQFNDSGESISFNFPLLNTLDPDSVSNNYQLLWMLMYQNRPYRRNRVTINPSRIYTLNIPGVRYVPFAYIANLDVQFQGTRREVEIPFPSVNGGSLRAIKVVVPEAYNVTITMESLTNESANFMLKSIVESLA
tara:strand:- start:39003 stop:40190 length:1188 start_codon:yes stop_codon:yes gene_type:complete